MRYYLIFRLVIPHQKADYPRVTHPCATSTHSEELSPFDLHVLGTPPAFALSQNQTLQLKNEIQISTTRAQSASKFLELNIRLLKKLTLTVVTISSYF